MRHIARALEGFRRLEQYQRVTVHYLLDASAWVLAIVVATVVRYDFDFSIVSWSGVAVVSVAAIVVQLISGWATHLYRGRHSYASFAQLGALVPTMLITAFVVGVPVLVAGVQMQVPRSAILVALPIALMIAGGFRFSVRSVSDRLARPSGDVTRALVYGAGYLGSTIVRRMITDRASSFTPVGLIDDNPTRRRSWIDGVRVLGTGAQLAEIAERTRATVLVVAIAKADGTLLRSIADQARIAHLTVKVLPPLEEILEGQSRLRDLRDISIEDLMGRSSLDTDVESVAGYLRGKRVLVTGAGGSIGSELCNQISKFGPAELVMLDHDETALQRTQIIIRGNGLLDSDEIVLASVREAETLLELFERRRPEVVFHTAALKHLPVLERYPDEAWKSNVLGTLNVLEAAGAVGVETFVNISTDKAANPTSVLGHSKRVAERLTAWAAEETGRRYLSVRFGNVIGSRGSMLPTFTSLIEAGGPLTITHPDVTRFFMTIPEACQLVLQAGGIGQPGEVLLLDMGEPVRILDIAQRMIDMSGKDIAIVYTGLRPGEKMHEELIGSDELGSRPVHPKISHTRIKSIAPERLDQAEWKARMGRPSFEMVDLATEGVS